MCSVYRYMVTSPWNPHWWWLSPIRCKMLPQCSKAEVEYLLLHPTLSKYQNTTHQITITVIISIWSSSYPYFRCLHIPYTHQKLHKTFPASTISTGDQAKTVGLIWQAAWDQPAMGSCLTTFGEMFTTPFLKDVPKSLKINEVETRPIYPFLVRKSSTMDSLSGDEVHQPSASVEVKSKYCTLHHEFHGAFSSSARPGRKRPIHSDN